MASLNGLGLSSPSIGYGHKRTASSNLPADTWRERFATFLGSGSANTSPALSSRRFYRDEPRLRSPRPGAAAAPPVQLGRATLLRLIIRPLLLLSRRGPLLPLVVFIFLILLLSGSMSGNSRERAPTAGRIGRLMAGMPRPQGFNPYRWARARLGREEGDLDLSDDEENDSLYGAWQQEPAGQVPLARRPAQGEVKKQTTDAISAGHRHDGRILLVEGQRHPIPALMRRARKRWDRLKGRQSKTFAQAISEYRKRYGRPPPQGFDRWYAFARSNDVRMIDEFDLIERNLHVFRAFSPESLRRRVEYLAQNVDFTWGVRVQAGQVLTEGELATHDRARGVKRLMRRFQHELPDMVMWYNGHDNARIMIPWEERIRLERLVAGKELDDDVDDATLAPKARGPFPYWGMAQTCPADSEMRAPDFVYGDASRDWTGLEMPPLPEGAIGTVIESFKRTLDVCNSPQYRHFHTVTSWVYPHHPTALLPLFTPGVHGNFADIHCLITEQFELEAPHDPTWEERPFDRVVWRGQTSGPQWDAQAPWITSHRSRLHLLSHAEAGSRRIVVTGKDDVAHAVEVPNYRVNPLYLDTGMVGPAVQCIKSDGTCDEMARVFQGYEMRLSFDRSNLYKFVLDVDGNSWSGRFRRLMQSNAAVIKATLFPEFWTDWIIPWLHFIPVQVDYSDLYDVLAFFRGGLRGEGAHDDLARQIAENGRQWANEHFRYQDLEAYQFRLALEYGRLYALDRDSMDFEGDGIGQEPVW